MKNLYVMLAAVLFISCATYKPPLPSTAITQKVIPGDIKAVFKAANLWLLENNFNVNFKDEDPYQLIGEGDVAKLSGLKHDNWNGLSVSNPVSDCGSAGMLVVFYPTQARLSILFEQVDGGTRVKTSVVFSKFNPEPNASVSGIIQCVTTGVLEASLFSYLEGKR